MKNLNLLFLSFFSLLVACTNRIRTKALEEEKKLEQLRKEGKDVVTIYRTDGTVEYVDKNETFIAEFEKEEKLLPEDQKQLASEMKIPTLFFINIRKIIGKDFEKVELINKTGNEIPSEMMSKMMVVNNISVEQKTKIEDDFKSLPSLYKETIKNNWHCEDDGMNIYFSKNSDTSFNLIVSKP